MYESDGRHSVWRVAPRQRQLTRDLCPKLYLVNSRGPGKAAAAEQRSSGGQLISLLTMHTARPLLPLLPLELVNLILLLLLLKAVVVVDVVYIVLLLPVRGDFVRSSRLL